MNDHQEAKVKRNIDIDINNNNDNNNNDNNNDYNYINISFNFSLLMIVHTVMFDLLYVHSCQDGFFDYFCLSHTKNRIAIFHV